VGRRFPAVRQVGGGPGGIGQVGVNVTQCRTPTSVASYKDGFIPFDVMPDGTPVGAFLRLDRGKEPTDHHTLFVATGLEPKDL
jgi:hypothetical protein